MFSNFELTCLQEFLIETQMIDPDKMVLKKDQLWIELGKEPHKFLIIGRTDDDKAGIAFHNGVKESQIVFKTSNNFIQKIAAFISGITSMDRATF